jgi:hypothetical protein
MVSVGSTAAVQPFGVRRDEVALDLDVDGEVVEVMVGTVAHDLDQPDRRPSRIRSTPGRGDTTQVPR